MSAPSLLVGNVVSDAYFERPSALPAHLHETGDRLGVRMLWRMREGDVALVGCHPGDALLRAAGRVLGFDPHVVACPRRGRETLPEAALGRPGLVRALRGLGVRSVVPYAHSEDVYRLAEALGAPVLGPGPALVRAGRVRAANSKTAFRRVAAALGVPLAAGEERAPGDDREPRWRGDAALILKERLSGGGLGNRLVAAGEPLAGHAPRVPFVVERFESFRSWPSADFEVLADGAVVFRQVSLMRVAGETNAYDGVVVPPVGEADAPLGVLVAAGRRLGEWWAERGYRGWFDIDGGVTTGGRCVLTELNARCTGGTPIDAVARRLAGDGYLRERVLLAREHMPLAADPERVVGALLAAGLVPAPGVGAGVVPLWTSVRPASLGYLVVAPDLCAADRLEREVARLCAAAAGAGATRGERSRR